MSYLNSNQIGLYRCVKIMGFRKFSVLRQKMGTNRVLKNKYISQILLLLIDFSEIVSLIELYKLERRGREK